MRLTRIFLDSSVIIAGLASSQSGSREILNLAECRSIIPVISEDVVREVVRNIEKKLPDFLPHYYHLFRSLPFVVVDASEESRERAMNLINPQDAMILAAAQNGKIDWLLSLDKHLLIMMAPELPFKIGTPGDFLQSGELKA